MSDYVRGEKLLKEEVKAVKLFVWIFYIFFFGYDLFYYYIVPKLSNEPRGLPQSGLGYWMYFLVLCLLPIAFFLLKNGKPYLIKYIYTFSYMIIDITNYLMVSFTDSSRVNEGNLVELFLMLFAPIFINKKYFWFASATLLVKYLFLFIIIQDSKFLFPVILLTFFAIVSYIFLARFTSYITTVTSVFEKQHQNEKLAVLGQMATSIGHEIRNPLSALKGFTQLQQERDTSKDSFYPIMIQEIDRINSIVDDLMVLGRPKSPNYMQQDMNKIIDYVTSVTTQLAENYGSNILVSRGKNLPEIECNEKQMKQALINILKNAIESMPNGGTVEVEFVSIGNEKIKIMVQDQGCGIDTEKLKRLGEPFYTTKQEGTGLGLLITKKIIEDHHGELLFESQKGKGTKVSMIIPIKQTNI